MERVSRLAADACDAGRDPSPYLSRLEELIEQPIDPAQFKAKLGPRQGREFRRRSRRVIGNILLALVLLASLPVALLWPVIVGAGYLLGKVERNYWERLRPQPWYPARFVLRLLFVPSYRSRVGERILQILVDKEPLDDL